MNEMMKTRSPLRRQPGMALVLAAGLAVALSPLGTRLARAHPHVWVVSASEFVYDAGGAITGIRHAWTFDEMFSTYAVQGLETKTKGVYTRQDLADLAETNVTSLKEFAYFTYAKSDGKKQKFTDPVDYWLEYKDNALTLRFTLPLAVPVKTRELAVDIYDPSYFVDFALAEKDPIKLAGAPSACSLTVTRPSDGKAKQQPLNEQSFLSGDNSNYGAMFANKVLVKCP
jgi:ABC-type uncharacterized transport system substrate-binding protein